MSKVCITKEFVWDMSHMLAGHSDLCRNLHGHTYKLQVQVFNKNDYMCTNNDMVIDFKDIKALIKSNIIAPFDHAFVYWRNSTDPVEIQIAALLEQNGRKTVPLNFRPTAEKLVVFFHDSINEILSEKNLKIYKIKLWETPTSSSELVLGE